MAEKNNGGPAFPNKDFEGKGLRYDEASDLYEVMGQHPGMTLRDYFAATAMQGWLASCVRLHIDDVHPNDAAGLAYRLADAMLTERTK